MKLVKLVSMENLLKFTKKINFYRSNIGIYISNVEYDTDRIQIAINKYQKKL